MKKAIITALLSATLQLVCARALAPVVIDSLDFDRHGDFMVVDMDIDLREMNVKTNRAQVITPLIVSEKGDTVQLPSVGVYGRQRYLNYLRNDSKPLSRGEETTFESSSRPEGYDYLASVGFEPWMDGSSLLIRRRIYGCTNCLIEERTDEVAKIRHTFEPEFVMTDFRKMKIDTIEGALEGAAYIDFVVNKTDINPSYRRNPQELLKIQHTIDTVLNDNGVTITGVSLKGFASPESPYLHNAELARGRTEALKDHLRQLYNFDPQIIRTDYEPEDWDGLRKAVEASNIDHKADILEIIDSDLDPDPKEALLKKKFPKEYKFMLANFYPALRHTEYQIKYRVKHIDDVDQIREMMHTRPNRLTLREFYILANACEPGSDEYFEIYETAARMYPDDPIAAINTAYAALKRKDFASAEKYLTKAGDSDDANYARGALAYIQGDYSKAESLLKSIPDHRMAQNLLNEINEIRAHEVQKNKTITLE